MTFPVITPPSFTAASPFAPATPKPAQAKDAPAAGRLTVKGLARRKARLRRAAEALGQLPGPGEGVHFLVEGFFDPADLIEVALRSEGAPCQVLRVSTLSFSKRNVAALCRWLDDGLALRLVLLGSEWMRDANPAVWHAAVKGLLEERGQTVAAARCHAKVACLDFGEGAGRLVFEGSGNLSSCRCVEQIFVARDDGLHDFHAAWIDAKVRHGESD